MRMIVRREGRDGAAAEWWVREEGVLRASRFQGEAGKGVAGAADGTPTVLEMLPPCFRGRRVCGGGVVDVRTGAVVSSSVLLVIAPPPALPAPHVLTRREGCEDGVRVCRHHGRR